MNLENLFSAWLLLTALFLMGMGIGQFRPGGRGSALKRVLGITYFVFGYFLGVKFLLLSGFYTWFPHLIGTANPLWLVFGPLIYWVVRLAVNREALLRRSDIPHLFPFICYLCFLYDFYLLPGQSKLILFQKSQESPVHITPFFLFSSLILLGYLFLSYRIWTSGENRLDAGIKNSGRVFLIFRGLLLLLGSYFLLDFLFCLILAWQEQPANTIHHATQFMISLFMVSVGVLDWRTAFPGIFENAGLVKYRNSNLPESQVPIHLRRLRQLMERDKPYRDENLSLGNLATMLGLSSHQLSQLLNAELDENFYTFINRYRIREAQVLLKDERFRNFTILAVAQEVGFRSKTTFNRLFKKHTGVTPSEYLKSPLALEDSST